MYWTALLNTPLMPTISEKQIRENYLERCGWFETPQGWTNGIYDAMTSQEAAVAEIELKNLGFYYGD